MRGDVVEERRRQDQVGRIPIPGVDRVKPGAAADLDPAVQKLVGALTGKVSVMAKQLEGYEKKERERELTDQLFRMRIQKSMGQLEAPAKVRLLRKDLARIKTVLREKQTAGNR